MNKIRKILSLKFVAAMLLLSVFSSSIYASVYYVCSDKAEKMENCCCQGSHNDNDVAVKRTNCECCITQGRPIDNTMPAGVVLQNNLIQDNQYAVESDINAYDLYSTHFNISISHVPLITQDIHILNANLRI